MFRHRSHFHLCELRDAITAAIADNLNDTINFSVSGTILLSSTLNITGDSPLTITGAGQNITLSGNNSQEQAFGVDGQSAAALNNLTIADFTGGVSATSNTTGSISNLGTLTVSNSTFYGNSAVYGGAIFSAGPLTVTNSTFSSNSAVNVASYGLVGLGGAIYSGGPLTVTNSTFSGNSTAYEAAPSTAFPAAADRHRQHFSGNFNREEDGGAIYLAPSDGSSVVTNSTFWGNTAGTAAYGGQGGGFFLLDGSGPLTIANSTFAGNLATAGPYGPSGNGGPFYNGGNNTVTLTNTILASSPNGGNCRSLNGITDGGGNLSDDATCGFSSSSRNSVATLNLGTLANNGGPTQTIALNSGSAAIGFDTANCPAMDQRGVTRPSPTQCDAGAYQTGTAAISLVKSANIIDGYSAPGTLVTYMYTVTNTGPIPLSQFFVSDPMPNLSAVSCPSGSLAPAPASAASVTCTATYTTTTTDVTNGSITNTGTATGTPFGTPPVGPKVTAPSSVTIPAEQTASIAIVLSAMPANFSTPGTVITYSYLVTNSGNVGLSSVSVNDSMAGLSAISCPSTTLAAAASETCTAAYTTTPTDVTNGSIANSATASGTTPLEAVVASPLSMWTIPASNAPAIGVVKSASIASYSAAGTPVTYSYNVTNTGNEILNPVTVTDPMTGLSAISCPVTFLAPTATETCTATYTTTANDVTNGSIINTGTATGTAETGSQATATSTLTIPFSVAAPCSVGSYSATGDTPCTLAPAGYYVNNPGATSATQCGLGTYSTGLGNTSCTSALPGCYVGSLGATAETQCGLGTYSTGSGNSSCTSRSAGLVRGHHRRNGGNAVRVRDLLDRLGKLLLHVSLCRALRGHHRRNGGNTVRGEGLTRPARETPPARSLRGFLRRHHRRNGGNTVRGEGLTRPATGNSSCTLCSAGLLRRHHRRNGGNTVRAGTYSTGTGNSSCTQAPAGSYVGSPAQRRQRSARQAATSQQ